MVHDRDEKKASSKECATQAVSFREKNFSSMNTQAPVGAAMVARFCLLCRSLVCADDTFGQDHLKDHAAVPIFLPSTPRTRGGKKKKVPGRHADASAIASTFAHSPLTLSTLSPPIIVSLLRYPLPQLHLVCEAFRSSSFSFSSHRHTYLCISPLALSVINKTKIMPLAVNTLT